MLEVSSACSNRGRESRTRRWMMLILAQGFLQLNLSIGAGNAHENRYFTDVANGIELQE
jgi:hypothetical protein